jgi:ATP-dependent Zn protease
MTNSFFDPLEDDEDDIPMRVVGKRRLPPKAQPMPQPDALELIPQVVLEQALGKTGMSRLRGSQSLCLVVETRADDWVAPIERFLRQYGDWDKTVAKTLDQARRRDDTTGPDVLRILSKGGRALGVAGRFAHLPDAMVTAADIRVELPPITTEIIETVIRRMTRKRVTVPVEAARLGFGELVSCMRAGDSAAAIVERLERATSSARSITPIGTDVPHIQDLHGYGAAKEWALELIEDIQDWRNGKIEFDAISSRNAVLTSAPGLGKTTFAKSLAKSLGMPLIATSVGAWFANSPGHLDSVIKQVDQVFAAAAAAAPAVLFLDEIDAVPNRATLDSRGADWWLPVITHLLTTLDSAVSGIADKLIVIGATNHGDKLDAALIRPGRLDRLIHIGPPDAEALAGILRQHLGQDLAGEDLADAANLAFGATGSHVVAWVRAARRTARNAGRPMLMSDLVDVIAPKDDRSPELVERIAVHEAGHAVAAYATGLGAVLSVSIVAHGIAGGITVTDFDGYTPTRASIEATVVQDLAGRAAEEILLGEAGPGAGGSAHSDLARATRTLGQLHLSTGLGENMIFRADADGVPGLLAINERASQAVEADLRRLYGKALEMIRENAALVRAVADALLERRHLGPGGFLELVDRFRTMGKEPSRG